MKFDRLIKSTIITLVASGITGGYANAAQRVDIHPDYRGKSQRELEQHASRLRHQVEHASFRETVVHKIVHATVAGNMDILVNAGKAAAKREVKRFIETRLMVPGATNFTQAAGGGMVLDGASHAPAPAAVPAGRTINQFMTAFEAMMDAATPAQIRAHAAGHGGGVLITNTPARLNTAEMAAIETDLIDNLQAHIEQWIDSIRAANGAFLNDGLAPNSVPLAGLANLVRATDPLPLGDNQRDTFKAAIGALLRTGEFNY